MNAGKPEPAAVIGSELAIGMRFSLCLQDALTKNFILTGKVGTTKYFDRDHIASSYQRIDGSAMTDLELQMKWKF